MDAGHVLVGTGGELLSVDAGFCSIMQLPDERLRGRFVLDVTAPADRVECATAIHKLRITGRSFVITKRVLRDDGSLVWVKNTVSITLGETPSSGTIIATVEPVLHTPERGPAALLDVARRHIDQRKDRAAVCSPEFFSLSGWDTVLAAYVAEAEGRSMDVASLAEALGKSVEMTDRWVRALLAGNVLEIEYRNPDADAAKAYRLTATTHEKLEAFLARHY